MPPGLLLPLLLLGLGGVVPVAPCVTGVAHVSSLLSVPRSLMANADVALLHTYSAPTLARCMEECCTRTYGACSVASFKRNATKDNCMHFYCRPLNKCKFLSSNSTDTFSFSSETSSSSSSSTPPAKEDIATFSEEQFAPKNDNTTVKPRKGVGDEDGPLGDPLHQSSGSKPRKGVSKVDVPHSELIASSLSKSNVKARKGVEDLLLPTPQSFATEHPSSASPPVDFELMSALEKVFDDGAEMSSSISVTATTVRSSDYHGASLQLMTSSASDYSVLESGLLPSVATPSLASSVSVATKALQLETFTKQFVSAAVEERILPRPSSSTIVVVTTEPSVLGRRFHEKLLAKAGDSEKKLIVKEGDIGSEKLIAKEGDKKLIAEAEEAETDRKYKSSIHLVLSLVFGLLVLFTVLGVVAKRVYDGWLRRDYFRMNYLIDGIYNGVD